MGGKNSGVNITSFSITIRILTNQNKERKIESYIQQKICKHLISRDNRKKKSLKFGRKVGLIFLTKFLQPGLWKEYLHNFITLKQFSRHFVYHIGTDFLSTNSPIGLQVYKVALIPYTYEYTYLHNVMERKKKVKRTNYFSLWTDKLKTSKKKT